jgi:hypothetical protein
MRSSSRSRDGRARRMRTRPRGGGRGVGARMGGIMLVGGVSLFPLSMGLAMSYEEKGMMR